MQLLRSNSGLIVSANGSTATHPGLVDHFDRPDGLVGGPWDDAHEVNSARWDQATITNGTLVCTPTHLNGDADAGTIQDYLLGLWLITMDIGLSDNFEVGLEWVKTYNADLAWQADVAVFVDPTDADEDVGIVSTYDFAVLGSYFNRVAHPPTADLSQMPLWQNNGSPLGSGAGWAGHLGPTRSMIRASGGQIRKYQDGRPQGVAFTVPAWATGRTRVGIQVLGLSQQVGDTDDWGDESPVPFVHPTVIRRWWWRPFNGTL